MNETALVKSISMIGSADGPTAIFLAGKINVALLAVTIVIGLLIGFFGLKLVKIVAALLGFLIGAGAGAGICAVAGINGIASTAIILVCAILLAVLSFLVYRLGVFVMIFICSAGVLASVLPQDNSVIVIIGLAVALALAILAAVFAEPMIMVITGIAGGFLAGPAILDLSGVTDPSWLKYVAGAVLAILGVLIQFMMQSSKIGKKERIKSEHIKEQVSMENEVEKARMILDDHEEEEESEVEQEPDTDTEPDAADSHVEEIEPEEGYLDDEDEPEDGYLDDEDEPEDGYLDDEDESNDIDIKELDLDDIPSDDESEE